MFKAVAEDSKAASSSGVSDQQQLRMAARAAREAAQTAQGWREDQFDNPRMPVFMLKDPEARCNGSPSKHSQHYITDEGCYYSCILTHTHTPMLWDCA